ncbi:MAG: ParB N-terminal domain-containing protein [Chloroflexota bacterium]
MFVRFRRAQRQVKDFYRTVGEKKETAQTNIGVQDIPLVAVVGSVGRAHELDRRFRSKQRGWSERHQQIEARMRQGKWLPPIKLFLFRKEERTEYFVLDGHHRMAVALKLGLKTISAEVVEVIVKPV